MITGRLLFFTYTLVVQGMRVVTDAMFINLL